MSMFEKLHSSAIKVLNVKGWEIKGINPPELVHQDGSIAKGKKVVELVLNDILNKEWREQNEKSRINSVLWIIKSYLDEGKTSITEDELMDLISNPPINQTIEREPRLEGKVLATDSLKSADTIISLICHDYCRNSKEAYEIRPGVFGYDYVCGRAVKARGRYVQGDHGPGKFLIEFIQ